MRSSKWSKLVFLCCVTCSTKWNIDGALLLLPANIWAIFDNGGLLQCPIYSFLNLSRSCFACSCCSLKKKQAKKQTKEKFSVKFKDYVKILHIHHEASEWALWDTKYNSPMSWNHSKKICLWYAILVITITFLCYVSVIHSCNSYLFTYVFVITVLTASSSCIEDSSDNIFVYYEENICLIYSKFCKMK